MPSAQHTAQMWAGSPAPGPALARESGPGGTPVPAHVSPVFRKSTDTSLQSPQGAVTGHSAENCPSFSRNRRTTMWPWVPGEA